MDKPLGKSSFSLVQAARRLFQVRCIGHAGTLDPLATGLVILLIGKKFTRMSDQFLGQDKVYETTIMLGAATTTYDAEGPITESSSYQPELAEVESVLSSFQGKIWQEPPMFSAKKVGGKKLYELARKGHVIARQKEPVEVSIRLLSYCYPYLQLHIRCSKGTYIRSLGHEIGKALQSYGHLATLRRLASGPFLVANALPGEHLFQPPTHINDLKRSAFYDIIPSNL